MELQEIAGERYPRTPLEDDGLVVLRQLPAPLFALDTLHTVLAMMARSVVLTDPVGKTEVLDMVYHFSLIHSVLIKLSFYYS